jgi:ligand-binding sensor domain-containing protein
MKKSIYYSIVVIVFLSISSQAQQGDLWINFKNIDGLGGSCVPTIAESNDGTMWFGTNGGGVSHYGDGNWKTYTEADGLCCNFVNTVFESGDGALWFGTISGLSCFRTVIEDFYIKDGLADDQFFHLRG